ncbi:PH domain-containing protein [Phocicoccus pinnipedialis]|uniref:Bacterial membrane flanked domain protein n=2 Tax=Bacteria TaxID=2 RepID=A0A6V7R540_9BACL|nr:PH domain-containing protein [Jeotgalicoccus pinnipedialis]MBP1939917.1 putative membrane protein [Jeotgalicoccus pinnipedialis]CAD2072135.1 Bacterial membrane flanked domain protein [Jeotgalicoccus pinnipedialis]
MNNPQKLHPLAYLGAVGSTLKTFWIPAAVFLFNFIGGDGFKGNPYLLYIGILVFLFMIVLIVMDIIQKYKTRFWIEDGKFIFKTGIFVLKEKELTINRIQSIDITQPIFLRIFGVCKLDIQTPADGISIDGIKLSQAEEIRRSVYKEKAEEKDDIFVASDEYTDVEQVEDSKNVATEFVPEAEMKLIHQMSMKELFIMAMTSGGLGIFIAGFFTFLTTFNIDTFVANYIEVNLQKLVTSMLILTVVIAIGVIIVGYVIGTVILLIRYYDYKVFEDNDDLIVQYGLLEKKRVTVNINRVQNIIIKDNILRRMFGFKSLYVTIMGDSEEELSDGKVMIVPLIKTRLLFDIVNQFFPNYEIKRPVKFVKKHAYRRYFTIRSIIILAIYGALVYVSNEYFVPVAFWLIAVIGAFVFILQIISALYSAKHTGYTINGDEINMMETSFFARSHYAIKSEKINTVEWHNNPFTRRAQLGTVSVITAGGVLDSSVTLKHLERSDIDEIWDFVEGGIIDEANIEKCD